MAVKQYTLYDIGGGSGESLYVTTLLLVVVVAIGNSGNNGNVSDTSSIGNRDCNGSGGGH